MTVKTKAGRLTVILLIAAIFVSILALPATAANVDLSTPGATGKVKLTASDILMRFFGGDDGFYISDEERAYLDKYSGESLSYSEKLPSTNVESEYDVQAGVLTVSAKKYSYTSVSGVKTVWTPVSVRIAGATLPLAYDPILGTYSATVGSIEEGSVSAVTVIYTADVSFTEQTLNTLLTKAYNDAEAWERYSVYLSELRDYTEQLDLYKQYLIDQKIYDEKNDEYQAYLKEKDEYDAAKALFDKYEAELAKYNADYALYVKYLADKEAYDKNLKAYHEYLKNSALVKAQLAVIDGTDKGLPTQGRPLRGAILGPTVTQVIENKDAIANEVTGVHGSVVDDAGIATEKLRELYDGYFAQKDEASKYIYYSLNYEQWRDSFTKLFQSLDFLYQNGKVKFAIGEMDMTWKFQVLLAELYYVVTALNDKTVERLNNTGYFDSSYTIDKKKPISYTENVAYVTDPGTAEPVPGGYPARVEDPGEAPLPVSEPKKPATVARPIPPHEVENPGDEPVEVDRPEVPESVSAPDKKLVINGELSPDIQALVDAYRDGKLVKREKIAYDRVLTVSAEAVKSVLKVDEITVHFYDSNGQLLSSVKADRGGYVEFSGKLPQKTASDKVYTFIGWQTADGVPVDMNSVTPDGKELSVYPAFSEEIKKFTVQWRIEGDIVDEEYEYGEIPSCPEEPKKDRIGAENFVFVGWNKEIKPVTADAVYTAQFKPVPVVSDKNGMEADVDLVSDPERFIVDFTGNMGREFDLAGILSIAAEEMKGMTVILKNGTVILSFSDVIAIRNCGATVISLSTAGATADGEGSVFKLSFTSSDGRLPDASLRAFVEIPTNITTLSNTTLTRVDGATVTNVPASITETLISAEINAGVFYETRREFGVSKLAYADIPLTVDKTSCEPGDIVHVSFSAPLGIRVVKLYYIGDDGEKTTVSGSSFIMPSESVTVGIEYEYVTYVIRFASDGKVIHTVTHKPGELPSFPGAPVKAADSDYTYNFVGWDREFEPADGNTVYNAVYEKKEIVREAPKEGLIITDGVLRILVLAVVALIYMVAIVIPCGVIVIVKAVRRSMRKLPKKAK